MTRQNWELVQGHTGHQALSSPSSHSYTEPQGSHYVCTKYGPIWHSEKTDLKGAWPPSSRIVKAESRTKLAQGWSFIDAKPNQPNPVRLARGQVRKRTIEEGLVFVWDHVNSPLQLQAQIHKPLCPPCRTHTQSPVT